MILLIQAIKRGPKLKLLFCYKLQFIDWKGKPAVRCALTSSVMMVAISTLSLLSFLFSI